MSFFRSWRRLLLAGLGLLLILAFFYSFFSFESDESDLPLSDVLTRAKQGEVAEIDVSGDRLTVKMTDGSEYKSRKEHDTNIIDVLQNNGVQVGGEDGIVVDVHRRVGVAGTWAYWIIAFLPSLGLGVLLLAGAYWVFQRARRPNA